MVHPALKQKTNFTFSIRLRDLNAAQKWGINDPSDFDELPKNSKIDILAWYEAKWRIEAIQAWDDAEKAKREAKQKQGKK